MDFTQFQADWLQADKQALESCGYDFESDAHNFTHKMQQSSENAVKIASEIMENGVDIGGIIAVIAKPKALIKHDTLGWIFTFREKGQRKDRYIKARDAITRIAMTRSTPNP